MEPEGLCGAEVGQLVERVDRACVHGAGVADDDRRPKARPPVCGDGLLQQVDTDAEAVVRRDLPQLPPADAEEIDGLVHAVVDLVGDVDDERRGAREAVLPHAGGHRARAVARAVKFAIEPPEVKRPSAVAGRPDLGEPRDDAPLHVDRRVVSAPAVAVHRRGEVVGRRADRVGRGVDEREEARVRVAEGPREDPLAHGVEHRLDRLAVLGQRLLEESRRVAHLAEDRLVERPARWSDARSAAS